MLFNIVSPKWLHRRRSNSQRLNFKSHRLNNIPLGNRYICLLQNNVAFSFMFRLNVCCLGTLGELNILRHLAHTILTEIKTVKIKIIIVRLYPGLINKSGILRMNKTNIIPTYTLYKLCTYFKLYISFLYLYKTYIKAQLNSCWQLYKFDNCMISCSIIYFEPAIDT